MTDSVRWWETPPVGPMTGWHLHYIGDGLYQVILFLNGLPIEYAVRSDTEGRGPWPKATAEAVLADLTQQLAQGIHLEAV